MSFSPKSPSISTQSSHRDTVTQLEHRLLTLEAELKEMARGGAVGQTAFMRRLKRLGKAHNDVSTLRKILVNGVGEDRSDAVQELTGLPALETLTPQERAMCDEHLAARADGDEALAEEAETVHRWLDQAVRGKALALGSIFRLAKLRKLIDKHGRSGQALEATGEAQERHAEKLVAAFGVAGKRREAARSTLDRLVSLYRELDQALVRVARLRTAYRKEEAKATKLAGMIRVRRQKLLTEVTAPFFPPPPSELNRARGEAEKIVAPQLQKARQRRATIERFWEDVMGRAKAQPAAASVEAAQRLLRPEQALEDVWRKTRAELRKEIAPRGEAPQVGTSPREVPAEPALGPVFEELVP